LGTPGESGNGRAAWIVGRPAEPDTTFARERQTESWDRGQPLRSGDSVTAAISRFSPKDVTADVWERIRPVVTAAVTGASPETPGLARRHLTIATQLAVWADQIGVPLEHTVLFHPETIDRFIKEGCAHLSIGSRTNYRSQLWKFGEVVIGPEHFPPHPLPLRRSPTNTPYSKAEVTELVAWSRGLTTAHMRRNAQALLAIGLGAGLSSQEVSRLVGNDVQEQDGLVLVEVIGEKARTVPVLHTWGAPVLELAKESGDRAFFRPERSRITRADIVAFINRCSNREESLFCIQRTRITWMVTHLAAGTHLAALHRASGVTAAQLTKYLAFVPPLDDMVAYRHLSEAAQR
jgi:integrase